MGAAIHSLLVLTISLGLDGSLLRTRSPLDSRRLLRRSFRQASVVHRKLGQENRLLHSVLDRRGIRCHPPLRPQPPQIRQVARQVSRGSTPVYSRRNQSQGPREAVIRRPGTPGTGRPRGTPGDEGISDAGDGSTRKALTAKRHRRVEAETGRGWRTGEDGRERTRWTCPARAPVNPSEGSTNVMSGSPKEH